jgi:hypothetical protein
MQVEYGTKYAEKNMVRSWWWVEKGSGAQSLRPKRQVVIPDVKAYPERYTAWQISMPCSQ